MVPSIHSYVSVKRAKQIDNLSEFECIFDSNNFSSLQLVAVSFFEQNDGVIKYLKISS